jgi:ABC-type cobalamin/Fe3+-siderophores transport system ATPase subunit
MNIYNYPIGSEWRKWDLHVHTPISYENHFSGWETYIKKLKEKAIKHGVEVVGINDYFSVDGYEKLLDECEEETKNTNPCIKLDNGKMLYLFPVVELRLENLTSDNESVNIHVVFSPNLLPSTIRSSFLEKLRIKYQSHTLNCKEDDLIKIGNAEENNGRFDVNIDLASFPNSGKKRLIHKALKIISFSSSIFEDGIDRFQKILKESGIEDDKYLIIIANKGRGGLDAFHWHDKLRDLSRAGNIRQNLLNLSDACFSNDYNDIQFLLGQKNDIPKDEILNRFRTCKPCIWGSDAHTEENLFHPSNGNTNDYTWIKADPTFEGLKQIIYEPEPGERVKICPVEPDQKDGYKVISKIRFNSTNDFPSEIEFNKNLCSIIGSRSSGKSALLAYIAHSVDAALAERLMIDGPGEGEDYHWDKIKFEYSIEWRNGQTNNENSGKIVYIPQNHLFEKSKDSDEIKEKIKPVLFKVLPDFEVKYAQAENNIDIHNQKILEQMDDYFELSASVKSLNEQLKNLGNKKAIKKEKGKIKSKIKKLKEKNQLSDEEIKEYQKISANLSTCASRIKKISTELLQLSDVSEKRYFFNALKITISPALANLPKGLQDAIKESLRKTERGILEDVNKKVVEYKNSIEKEKIEVEGKNSKIKDENKELIEKYQKNIELQGLLKKLNEYVENLKRIDDIEKEITDVQVKLKGCEKIIKTGIDRRKSLIEELAAHIKNVDQSIIVGIKFGIEYGFGENLENVTQKINIRDKSEFIEKGQLKIDYIREKPGEFLSAVYLGEQKVIAGNDKKEVVRETLSLTEKVLFTAEMEGDQIGGFSEPTMTPGKRALFLLRLILAESEETWPLLIDQPEDDLDSRSIYDDIVPFLKKKKKERQIIMVSHDANLVIGSDSEQVIVANRDGTDRENLDGKQFNYLTGSLEYSQKKDKDCKDTLRSQGVREHSCDILDGGKIAFEQRKNKYNIN